MNQMYGELVQSGKRIMDLCGRFTGHLPSLVNCLPLVPSTGLFAFGKNLRVCSLPPQSQVNKVHNNR